MMHVDPETPEQWQEAVDAADGALHFDAARQYGLISGGPKIDVERCEEIIARGKKKGITPRSDAGVAFAVALMEKHNADERPKAVR